MPEVTGLMPLIKKLKLPSSRICLFKACFMNKWLLCLLLVLCLTDHSFAQMPMGMGKGTPPGKMNIGRFYGKLVNEKNGKPVATATVMLMRQETNSKSGKKKQVIVKGVNSSDNGEFSLDEIPVIGTYQLTVTVVGYKPYEHDIYFDLSALAKLKGMSPDKIDMSQGIPSNAGAMLNAIDRDLGDIKLAEDEKQLEEVTVTAKTPAFRLEGEKKIFNVDQNIISQGGTATDVMKNVPGVIVDINNNVTLRNAAPIIYVDGQPTTLQLDQIPSDMIESVEVITNPSAKYDAAAGTGGIINIVLKKNRKHGYNGDVRAGGDSRGGYNAGADISVRQNKINFSANAMLFDINSQTTGYTDRSSYYEQPNTVTNQNNVVNTLGNMAFVRLGVDYFITNRTTISATGMFAQGSFDPKENLNSTTDTLSGGTGTAYDKRVSATDNSVKFSSYTLNMKHLFPKDGMEWTALGTYNGANFNMNSNYTTDFYNSGFANPITSDFLQNTVGNGLNKYFIGQTDFTYPFSKKSKLEAGLKATSQNLENNSNNYVYDSLTNIYTLIPAASLNYKSTQDIYAGYVTYSSAIGEYTYHAGLRAESSDYNGELTNTGQQFKVNYPISLFPSLFVSRKLKHDQELQFSYRRGIIRPTFFQMLPYTNYADPLNITQGNPGLQPGFTNSVEVNYLRNFKGGNYLLVSVYYKHTTNLITPYQEVETDKLTNAPGIFNTYENASSSDKYGAEITLQQNMTKWWDILADLNIYNGTIDANNISGNTPQSSMWSWFGKLNNNFTLPKNFTIQLSAIYQSKTNLLPDNSNNNGFVGGGKGSMSQALNGSQGYLGANYDIDLAIKKSFFKSKAASMSLSINDIFRSRIFLQHSESAGNFTQDYSQLKDPQLVRLNFTYRFGKLDMDLFKRKDIKSESEGMKNASENFTY